MEALRVLNKTQTRIQQDSDEPIGDSCGKRKRGAPQQGSTRTKAQQDFIKASAVDRGVQREAHTGGHPNKGQQDSNKTISRLLAVSMGLPSRGMHK